MSVCATAPGVNDRSGKEIDPVVSRVGFLALLGGGAGAEVEVEVRSVSEPDGVNRLVTRDGLL